MKSQGKFLITSALSLILGVTGISGHLDAKTSNDLIAGLQEFFYGILLVAPILYNLEHHSTIAQEEAKGKTVSFVGGTHPVTVTE